MFKYLVVGLVIILGVRAEYCTPERCPPEGQLLFPNNSTCSSFSVCINGTPHFRNCPDGQLFHNPSQMCRESNLVKCDCEDRIENVKKYVKNIAAPYVAKFKALRENEGAAANISERCIENSVTPVICPPDIGDERLMAHPDDCRLFYVCETIGQKPVCRDCPANLHFNPKLKVCDHTWNAGCMSHLVRPLPVPLEEKRSFQPIPYKFPGFTKGDFNAAYKKRTPFKANNNQCVQNSGPNADLRPNPEDCSKYYVCDSGHLISMSCPEGLHFSTVFKVCDLPQNARCQQNSTAAYVQETQKEALKSIPVKMPELQPESNTAYEKNIPFRAGNDQCIQNSGPYADLRPNPEDCSKYYVCDNGHLISMSCPEGLHFSTIMKVCDLPQNARCQQNSTAAYVQETQKGALKSIPFKMPELQLESNTAYEKRIPFRAGNDQCIQNSGPYADLRPNPEDCSKYYVCDNGHLISMSCPEGLHFSTILKVCDLPQNARCLQNSSAAYLQEEPNNDYEKRIPIRADNNQCVQNSGPYADIRPDPQDCGRFYVCDHDYLISMACPDGLHFSTILKVCDWPQNVRCQQNATEAYPAAVRNPKYVQVSQEPKKLGKLILPKEVIQCNAENGPLGGWADLRPDSDNCSKYYVCDRGTVHSMSCPDGLHFCAASKVCDYPERAQCQASSIWDRLRRGKDDSEENSSEDHSENRNNSEENSNSEEKSHKYLSY